jgi:tRNA pseudouridine13 synthase
VTPEDFVVEETPAYAPSGEGGHLFVHVEKRLRTTEEVAEALAAAAGVRARDVGYAGRKDRFAVTTQWLSVEGLSPEAARSLDVPGVRVLEAVPHVHKLRTGHLRSNRFALRVHGVDAAALERARTRLTELVARGLPNRFGVQRYGRDRRNVERGRAILLGRARGRDRRTARFMISALQSAVFDRVLAERPLPLDAVECGDVARVEESGGLFVVEDAAIDAARAARFEISATGPIFGTRTTAPTGAPAAREAAAHEAFGLPAPGEIRAPRGIRLRGARRPLRVRPEAADLEAEDGGRVVVRCALPPGSYATVLLEELFGTLDEGPEAD